MKITLRYSAKKNEKSGNWLGCNLSDLAHSLNVNLARHFGGSSSVVYEKPGLLCMATKGVTRSEVEPLVKAFAEAMDKREGFKILAAYE